MTNIDISNSSNQDGKMGGQAIFWLLIGMGTICFWCLVAASLFLVKNPEIVTYRFMPHPYLIPADGIKVFKETFETNDNKWGGVHGSRVKVDDGKLTLKAAHEIMAGVTRCFGCDYLGDSFYFQAELLPEENTSTEYGLTFCNSGKDEEYYVLLVDPVYSTYSLHKNRNDTWTTIINDTPSSKLNQYPDPNTLGVKFDRGEMDFYINGSIESSFTDPAPYSCTWSGMIANDGLMTLTVDNVFAYRLPTTPKP